MTRSQVLVEMRRASAWRTICEVHREIYDACKKIRDPMRTKVRNLVIEAFIMGKKIDARLREYKTEWDLGFYEKNLDQRSDRRARRRA